MLRGLKHPHIGAYLRAFKVTTAGTATVDIGAGDAPSAAVSSTSTATLTPYLTLNRPGIRIVQAAANIANGGYGIFSSTPVATSIIGRTLNASGVADAGSSYILALDYSNEFTDRAFPLQSVLTSARSPRMMGFKISPTGTVEVGGTQGTCSVASSVYTITFGRAFSRAPLVFASPQSSQQYSCLVTAVSATSVEISTFDSSSSASDTRFNLIVIGFDSKDEQWGERKVIQVPQLQPRIECFRATSSSDVVITLGGTDATAVYDSAGAYQFLLTKAFATDPIVVATGKSKRAWVSSTDYGEIWIATSDAQGIPADDDFCFLALGYDSAMEI